MMGRKRYDGKRPGGSRAPGNQSWSGNSRGPRLGTGGGGGGTGRGTNHKGGESSCSMWVPVAVALTLLYALPRMAWEDWKEKRNA